MQLLLAGLLLAFSAADAANLVPVVTPPPLVLPAGLEANKGQATPGILFLARGGSASTAVTAQSILYSPLGVSLNLLASNPNPAMSFSNPLPGLVNSYTGADPAKWVTGITRYTTMSLAAVLPGVDAQYTMSSNGLLTLNLLLAAGVDPRVLQFQMSAAASMSVANDGSLFVRLGTTPYTPSLSYPAPVAVQGSGASRTAAFAVQSTTTFGLQVQGLDSTQPLQISLQVNGTSPFVASSGGLSASNGAGNRFVATPIADGAGQPPPFSTLGGTGCANSTGQPIACSDVAIYGYSAAGVLNFITYLAGGTDENAAFLGVAPSGSLVVAGSTDSADFPVTAAAFQTTYAGPAPTFGSSRGFNGGDYFAVTLEPATGHLQASTYLGSPNADTMNTAALGADGSLYFLPAFVGSKTAGMPVSSGALLSACQDDPCENGYVARLSPGLDRLIFGTYVPGNSLATAQLAADGSVYYAGAAEAGFPVTATAYQRQNGGLDDGIIGRLDPTGTRLLAATYIGGPNTDWILEITAAPDGSVWANVHSFIQCCINIQPQLIHLDGNLSRLQADLPLYADQMVVNAAGNLIALAEGSIAVTAGSILGGSCGGPAYIELSPSGELLFATYLPGGYQISFDGADAQGTPYVDTPNGRMQVLENQPAPASAGCVVDAPSFTNSQTISPGEIVTIFGSGMGPDPGVGFQLTNGQVPVSLGGTQVLVNGTPVPILYSSYGQLNVIIPYTLAVGSTPSIQVVSNGTPLNALSDAVVKPAGISIFQRNGAAVALNQDFSVNSPQNPAQPGSTVMLFGTGGGQTSPASTAGEVTPLELRSLVNVPQVPLLYVPQAGSPPAPAYLNVAWAGAAPALVSGVAQINVTLPNPIPTVTGYPPGSLPFYVIVNGTTLSGGTVTIFAAAQ
ncbi:MAG TPA: hypothetical protein VG456_05035 [Candidatus Sulfopaludibacter sp.]|nr:hypothetical protein [Candidatus Sulfopaludibacter sp.]